MCIQNKNCFEQDTIMAVRPLFQLILGGCQMEENPSDKSPRRYPKCNLSSESISIFKPESTGKNNRNAPTEEVPHRQH